MQVPPFLQRSLSLYEVAEQYWDLRAFPTPYTFSLLALASEDALERDKCIELGSPEGQEDWLNYCRRPKRTVLEVLHDFHKTASKLTIPILFELFSTIKPRAFSIASSPLLSKGHSVDIMVAAVEYYTNLKKVRKGLCSNWLVNLEDGERFYGWIKKGTFVFPEDTTPKPDIRVIPRIPLILVGPGTGLAPFRGLIQSLVHLDAADKNTIHLFFGCRFRSKDYHCKEELEKWSEEGKISLYCAFSRDQENKIYVQHKIAEQKETLWRLIRDQNANIYIAGNNKMPDSVKDAFVEDVFCKAGGVSLDEARDLLRALEGDGRVQVEAY